jgi:polysaccharide pyruvyl transferase WcaK-like protein
MRAIVATGLNAGAAEYKNMGDIAMLQAAVVRLSSLWPDARIEVLTDSPSDLNRFCPRAKSLPRAGCECWVQDRVLLGRLHRFVPDWVSRLLSSLKVSLGLMWPGFLEFAIRLRLSVWDGANRSDAFRVFMKAFKETDILIVCGSGGFADSCHDWNLLTLGTMRAAIRRHIPVVMFGQGIGPLHDPLVLSRSSKVLPKVTLISLRGNRGGLSLLESIGVQARNTMTTGDEAIELAYAARADALGGAVGVNLRVATYSHVKSDIVENVGSILQDFARRNNAALLPIPIAVHEHARDQETIRELLAGFDDQSDGGLSMDTPQLLMEQTARCRIVVSGAYHAAVFALAQGIPVVCLSNSPYYLSKFQGLRDLFGLGCAIVVLDEPGWPSNLAAEIESAWNAAPALRLPLLQASVHQIGERRAAYRRVGSQFGAGKLQPTSSDDAQTYTPEFRS